MVCEPLRVICELVTPIDFATGRQRNAVQRIGSAGATVVDREQSTERALRDVVRIATFLAIERCQSAGGGRDVKRVTACRCR